MIQDGPYWGAKAQVEHAWAFAIDHLGPGTYALTVGRDTSLLDAEELQRFLQHHFGGQHDELGGGHVG